MPLQKEVVYVKQNTNSRKKIRHKWNRTICSQKIVIDNGKHKYKVSNGQKTLNFTLCLNSMSESKEFNLKAFKGNQG
jgi:hypothetical protein